MGQIDDLVDEARKTATAAAIAEAKFKSEFAKARISARHAALSEGTRLTTDMAEDEATVATTELREQHLLKSHGLTVVREALRAAEARLDGYRTLSASVRLAGG
jgi:hypothetical protein